MLVKGATDIIMYHKVCGVILNPYPDFYNGLAKPPFKLVPAWMHNYIPQKAEDCIAYPSHVWS